MKQAVVVILLTAASVVIIACGNEDAGSAYLSAIADAGEAAGTLEGLPAHAPAQFSFGAEASEMRIAMWDIDVRPDGEGLPAGSGTVLVGEQVYMVHCVACHGPTGVEGPNDRLVGTEPWEDSPGDRTIGGYWPYATTLYEFISKAMPQLTPGILSPDEIYSVIAYLLYLNEIVPEDAVIDAESLPDIQMPARDRFVIDDRVGGPDLIR